MEPGQLVGGLADFIQRRFHHHVGFHSATERDCDDLTIGSTDVLNFNNANSLTIDGTTITNSNSTGTGGITLGATNSNTNLIIGSSAVTLTGGGTVTLGNNGVNRIFGAVGTDVLTNANNIVQGSATSAPVKWVW